MEKKATCSGFSLVSFMVYIAIITASISLVLPLVSQLYKNVLTCVHGMHKDFACEYAYEIMKSDVISAPCDATLWKFRDDYISFKDSQKKIAWSYKNNTLYRIEKTNTQEKTGSVEKKIFLQNIPDLHFQVIQEKEQIRKVVCAITEENKSHEGEFLLCSGIVV